MNSKHAIKNAFKSLKLSAAATLTQTENDVMEGLFTLGKLVFYCMMTTVRYKLLIFWKEILHPLS